jgi:sucrose-6-phosphate hydrolase SacC (GH32 family)
MCLLAFKTAVGAIWLSAAINLSMATAINKFSDCKTASFPGPRNANFETGSLDGWNVVFGNAFGANSVTNSSSYWDGPFHQDGKYFVLGTAQSGETAVGELRSKSFRASSFMSFLIGGGYDLEKLYVGLVRDKDSALLLKQTGHNDEALIRIVWDTSKWAGELVHVVIVDHSTRDSWGHINFDDLRVGCPSLGTCNGKLTFSILGQANQPDRDTLDTCKLFAADPMRPQYHYTQYQGWINDPAGLSHWDGKHHLFSQFNPDAPLWGPMHWAHAESDDGVHWKELPVALYPKPSNNVEDTSGRFTGSAIADKDKLRLFLTDFTDLSFHPNEVQETVIVATSDDGINFDYFSKNPVIPGPPPGGVSPIFRDPKVFHDDIDNSWKMILSSEGKQSGLVHLYASKDQLSWSNVGVVYSGDGSTGNIWECPNLLPLDNKWVLFYGGAGLGWYEVGSYDGSSFISEKTGLIDAGPASYAMQWYRDEKGRNLAISWMGNWPSPKWASRVNGWAGQQSVTRELFIREDGGLGSRPIPELDSLASGPAIELGPKILKKTQMLQIGHTNTARLKLAINLGASNARGKFSVLLYHSEAEDARLSYDLASQILRLDTTNAGYAQAGTWEAKLLGDKELTLDIFIDRSSVEIFAVDGTVLSALVWPKYQQSRGIQLVAEGGAVVFERVSLTPLGSIWC